MYCNEDFLRIAADICVKCKDPILKGGLAVEGRAWHSTCCACEYKGCGTLLDGDTFAEHDGKLFCPLHLAVVAGESCSGGCGEQILPSHARVMIGEYSYHEECLKCSGCSKKLTTECDLFPGEVEGSISCDSCVNSSAPVCPSCEKPIIASDYMDVLGRKYHVGCMECAACGKEFTPECDLYEREGWPVCVVHAIGLLPQEILDKGRFTM